MLLLLLLSVVDFCHCCDYVLDFCRVSFACCYTYAGIPPDELLADAGGTAAEFQLAVLTLYLVILPLVSQNNIMFPIRAFKRRHF